MIQGSLNTTVWNLMGSLQDNDIKGINTIQNTPDLHSRGNPVLIIQQYHKARMVFVSNMAELATEPENAEKLYSLGGMALLHPFVCSDEASLTDPSVQTMAMLALGRLVNSSEVWCKAATQAEVLDRMVNGVRSPRIQNRKVAAFALKAVSRYTNASTDLCQAGALPALNHCLADGCSTVRETAACALGHLAGSSESLAAQLAEEGNVAAMVNCLQDSERSVQRMSLSALGSVVKYNCKLAEAVAIHEGGLSHVMEMLAVEDNCLRRQVCSWLCPVVKLSGKVAECVVDSDRFSFLLLCVGHDGDEALQTMAANVIKEVVKQSGKLAQRVNSAGAVGPLIQFMITAQANHKMPGIMALGFMAGSSEEAALAIIASEGVKPLVDCLQCSDDEGVRCAAAWALGQLAHHSSGHARGVASSGALLELAAVLQTDQRNAEFGLKCRKALLCCLNSLTHLPALLALLLMCADMPLDVMERIMRQLCLMLTKDPISRETFLASGGLTKMRQIYASIIDNMETHNQGVREKTLRRIDDYFDCIQAYYPFEMSASPAQSARVLEKLSSSIKLTTS